jgi:enoyl-CoA hydratase/carnithine racemase
MAASPAPERGDAPVRSSRRDGGAAVWLELNRPERLNALSAELLVALGAALEAAGRDPETRVVVIGGAGRAFSAGHDLAEMQRLEDAGACRELFDACSAVMLAIVALPVPVIARVHGVATAAGCQLVAACDLAVAARDARFATSGIDVGLFCATPSVPLSRAVPRKRAFEMLVTGEFIDADTALAIGLVNRVVEPGELDAATQALARTVAAKSPVAVATGKRMFYQQLGLDLERAYAYAAGVMAENMQADDAREGIAAFLAKRRPVWRGR